MAKLAQSQEGGFCKGHPLAAPERPQSYSVDSDYPNARPVGVCSFVWVLTSGSILKLLLEVPWGVVNPASVLEKKRSLKMKLLLFCAKGLPHYSLCPPSKLQKIPAELGPSAPTSLKKFTGICCTSSGPVSVSCLENPRDRGAWWAALYGVSQGRTLLKRLSSSSLQ